MKTNFLILSFLLLFGIITNAQILGTNTPTGGLNAGVYLGNNAGKYCVITSETGVQNTFTGSSAGSGNATNSNVGNANCFYGFYSGTLNTSGSHNSFYGNYSGHNNGSGSNNVMIGVSAGQRAVNGMYNTFVGTFAGHGQGNNLTTGTSYNTYLGYMTGKNNLGSNNTILGANSVVGPTSGSGNTVVGANLSIGSYSNSVIIGHGGGQGWDNIRLLIDSNGNAGLGTETPKNKLDIEGGAVIGENYSGSNAAATNGLLVEGNVGIGTTNPQNKLQLNSGVTGAAGLRFGNLTNSLTNKFLTVNGSGDVVLSTLPVGTSGPDTSIFINDGDLLANRTVYMKSNTLTFDTAPALENGVEGKVYIGAHSNDSSYSPANGFVTDTGNYKLYVEGGILTEKVKVAWRNGSPVNWADYVFADDYNLRPLSEVEAFVKENKHLPGIQSAKEIATEGLDLAEMQAKQMEKIEELTLYIIEQQKQLQKQAAKIDELERKVSKNN